MESGVHNVQFVADKYQTVGTNYYFEGNTQYLIDVKLEEKKDGQFTLALVKPVFGDIFVNGQAAEKETNRKSKIAINGNEILGEFLRFLKNRFLIIILFRLIQNLLIEKNILIQDENGCMVLTVC